MSCTLDSDIQTINWPEIGDVQIVDIPGFADNRGKEVQLKTYANIVDQTSQGLNIALFVIKVTDTRIDTADINGLQVLGGILSTAGVKHIHLIFTQVDRLSDSE